MIRFLINSFASQAAFLTIIKFKLIDEFDNNRRPRKHAMRCGVCIESLADRYPLTSIMQ